MKTLKEALFSRKNLHNTIKIDDLEVSAKRDSIAFGIVDGRIKFTCEVATEEALPIILRVLNQVEYDSGIIPDINEGYDLSIFFAIVDSKPLKISVSIDHNGDVVETILSKDEIYELIDFLEYI